jgi:hypothetical protein
MGISGFLYSTGIQIHDVLRVLRVKFFYYLRVFAPPREIKSVLRALRVLRVRLKSVLRALRVLRVRLKSVLRLIFTHPDAN